MSSQNSDEVTEVSLQNDGEGQEVGKEKFTGEKQQIIQIKKRKPFKFFLILCLSNQ